MPRKTIRAIKKNLPEKVGIDRSVVHVGKENEINE